MTEEKVKISVRYQPGFGLSGESLWAQPVNAHDGGGTYVLQNNAFHIPLAVGDLVHAELNGDGILQVTDIVQPAPVVLTSVAVVHGDSHLACEMGDRWREDGATWSEGMQGLLTTVWDPEVDEHRELQTAVDFELDTEEHFPAVETTYWAPDDPYWRERGLDSPDFLAYVQSLAGHDEVVARALEAGDHEKFRQMFEFINDGESW